MTSKSEEERILEEVKRLQQRARESGIITSVFKLSRENLPYYDAWATNCPEVLHPQIQVIDKTEARSRRESSNRIDAVIRGNNYVFTFSESTTTMPDGEPYTTGSLDVDFQGQRVMTIDCECEFEQYMGSTWHTRDVSAFIEGPWIAELNSVFTEVTRLHTERQRLAQEQAKKEKLEKIKKNFGL